MGKRYHCDYCDKSFPDSKEGRDKHINGVVHKRMKKEHYDQFRDPEERYREESAKKPCTRFHSTGQCQFGGNCIYTHLTPEQLQELRMTVDQSRRAREPKRLDTETIEALVEEIISQRKDDAKTRTKERKRMPSLWDAPFPNDLINYGPLPPSLLPCDPKSNKQ
ncbi:unnamed protein product, partial [Darwinula stevensoni]